MSFNLRTLTLIAFLICLGVKPSFAQDPLAQLKKGHPKLLISDEAIRYDIEAAKTDPLRAALNKRIIDNAKKYIGATPIKHVLIGPRLLDQSRLAIERIMTSAMAYKLTQDPQFLKQAKFDLMTVCQFKDWNPSHFLDVAEMSFAVSIGYDWLYAELNDSERTQIKEALLNYSLSFAPLAYDKSGPQDKRVWFVKAEHNWNQVCNGGLLSAALVLSDEKPDLARLVINGARKSLPLSMHAYEPDGAYPEGPGYWTYGTTYNIIAINLMRSALGTDFGLSDTPGFNKTYLYRMAIASPSHFSFNYSDGGEGFEASPAFTWLSNKAGFQPAIQQAREELKRTLGGSKNRFLALNALWFPEEKKTDSTQNSVAEDLHFRGPADIALFRSAWNDPHAIFLGLRAGLNSTNHSHLDLGSFVLDSDGVRWAEDLGPDNYNLPAYFGNKRWTYFRLNNFSHNIITPDRTLQRYPALAPIVAFKSTPKEAYAVTDLSKVYPNTAEKYVRKAAILDRSRVLIEDELTNIKKDTVLHWRMMTRARVNKSKDASELTLRQDGHHLTVRVLEPKGATLSVIAATPPSEDEKQNERNQLIQVNVNATPNDHLVRIAILLSPEGDTWQKLPAPEVKPIE
jgi:hypothetical protein